MVNLFIYSFAFGGCGDAWKKSSLVEVLAMYSVKFFIFAQMCKFTFVYLGQYFLGKNIDLFSLSL